MNERPTHIDLCAGFGGFTVAAEWAGFETVGFAEIADYPSRLLAERYPGRPNWGDIRNTPPIRCDLLTCGDPCPPFSIAGRKLGKEDHRYIWPSVLDAIGRHDPDWCLLENVVGITGLVLSERLDDLEARGYQCQAFDIPACAVGLSTVERHIWLVAARDGIGMARDAKGSSQPRPCLHEWHHGRAPTVGVRWDLLQPHTMRSRKGLPYYVERITGLGNAVPPPVAFEILRTIRQLT